MAKVVLKLNFRRFYSATSHTTKLLCEIQKKTTFKNILKRNHNFIELEMIIKTQLPAEYNNCKKTKQIKINETN